MKPEKEGQEIEKQEKSSHPRIPVERTARPMILVFSDYYLPGYKSGGGMRTLVNVVDRFGDDYDFRIVTRDHDGKIDKDPYPGIHYQAWTPVGKAVVRYLARDEIRISEVRRIASEIDPDLIFCNSYFSTLTIFLLLLRRVRLLKPAPFVIAPQGELSDGALGLKSSKKRSFLRFASRVGLYRDIVWRATSGLEGEEVERAKGSGGKIFIAADLSPNQLPEFDPTLRSKKEVGSAKLIFLSRIHPKKNLSFLLGLLGDLSGRVELDVVGPLDREDEYWKQCEELIGGLPPEITVNIVGEIEYESVPTALARHHFFVLPSLSENFGHVFIEAMLAGLPLIISDQTPWRDLADKNIGWDIPLEDRDGWLEVLSRCVRMSEEELSEMSQDARRFAENWVADDTVEQANRDVFEYALSMKAPV